MASRFKKAGPLGSHFIKGWRKYRGLSQDALADRLGISKATLSRIETQRLPYGQDFLEVCAELLLCKPADLLARDPLSQDGFWLLWSIWEQIPPAERPQALKVLNAFRQADTADAAD